VMAEAPLDKKSTACSDVACIDIKGETLGKLGHEVMILFQRADSETLNEVCSSVVCLRVHGSGIGRPFFVSFLAGPFHSQPQQAVTKAPLDKKERSLQ